MLSALNPHRLEQLIHMPVAVRELVEVHADFVQEREVEIGQRGGARVAHRTYRRRSDPHAAPKQSTTIESATAANTVIALA